MIDWFYGKLYVSCDACGRDLETPFGGDFSDFEEARAEMRKQGWKSVKTPPDNWSNYCPKCADRYARPGPWEFAGI